MRFQPMVFESQGGMATEAAAVLHKLANAVAQAENSDPSKMKAEILQRIGLALARRAASAIKRRRSCRDSPVTAACHREIARSVLLTA